MTRDQRAKLKKILDHHDEIARSLRNSSGAFDELVVHLRNAAVATPMANEAQRIAIDAMIEANRAALDLFNEE